MKRCNLTYISESQKKLFVADRNGYVPLPGDEMSDFNFDWGFLQSSSCDSKTEMFEKKRKRKSAFQSACVANINVASIKFNINTESWKEKDK